MMFVRKPTGRRGILSLELLDSRLLLSATSIPDRLASANPDLISCIDNEVIVHGTDDDNVIDVVLGAETHAVTIDGELFEFDATVVDRILVYAGEGNDVVSLTGTAIDDRVEANQRSVELLSTDYIARVEEAESITVETGEGSDRVSLEDTVGDDAFELRHDSASYTTASGRVVTVTGHGRAEAYARQGGIDEVRFFDSPMNDRFVGKYLRSFMEGDGFVNYARGFENIFAQHQEGGEDEARLFDHETDDELTAMAGETVFRVEFATYTVRSFPVVRTYASAGNDTAEVFGFHSIRDVFAWTPESAYMHSTGDYVPGTVPDELLGQTGVIATNVMVGFDTVSARASDTTDRAELTGGPSDDFYVALPGNVQMTSGDAVVNARMFPITRAFGGGGQDTAMLQDSSETDRFVGRALYAYLKNSNYLNYVSGFQVNASASQGGPDFADLSQFDGPGRDYLVYDGGQFLIHGPERSDRVVGFSHARAVADQAGIYEIEPYTQSLTLLGTSDADDVPSDLVIDEFMARLSEPISEYEVIDNVISAITTN